MRFHLAVLGCGLLAANVYGAPIPDDAPPDAAALDVQIAALAKARAEKKAAFFQSMREEIEHALQTPGAAGNYVIECMRKVQFAGEGGNMAFAEWKKKNRDLFSNHDFEQASELHLRYLDITLKRALLDSAEPVQKDVWDYLEALKGAQTLVAGTVREPPQVKIRVFDEKTKEPSGEITGQIENIRLANAANVRSYVQDLLNGDVSAGLVAQALKLNEHLNGLSDWEMVAGNFDGIIEQDIRATMRKRKDPALVATWDDEIAYLGTLAKLKDTPAQAEFETKDYPRLIWKKAKDVELIGMPNRALGMKIALAKQYPQHPDFEQWTTQISADLLKRKQDDDAKKAAAAKKESPSAQAATPAPAAPAN